MDVKVTVYLKSGGDTSMIIYDTTLEEQDKQYSKFFEKGIEDNIICHQTNSEVIFIPVSNIACLSLKELPK